MSIQDTIASDEAAVASAQAALDAANAQLAADQAKLAAVQPHIDLLTQIEAELAKVEEGVEETLRAALADVESRIKPLIAQMRDLFTN